MKQISPLSIAQVTDIHLFANENHQLLGLPTQESFLAVIERLKQLQSVRSVLKKRSQLDLLLLTGDLSQDGKAETYHRVQNLLSPLQIPTYWLPGNHDNPSVMDRVLHQDPFYPDKAFEVSGWNFVLLNSAVKGRVYGRLSVKTLHWLDLQLTIMGDAPTVVALHHPPFLVYSDWLDNSTLHNSEELFAVLDRHPQVKLVLFGHIHQEFYRQRNGVHYLGTPSTSIQFEPHSSDFALDTEYPGFRLLNLYPDGTWESRIERVAFSHELDLAAQGY
jgi:Icc protein